LDESQEVALIRHCQSGDKKSFRNLVEQYDSALFGTAYLMTRDRSLAEDAVQEALIKIWKNLPTFRFKSSIKTWMIRIVVNEVKQQFRKKQLPAISLENLPEIAGGTDQSLDNIILDEKRRNLRQAMDKLSYQHKEVLVLRFFSELTVPEIAAVTSQREGTIKSRLSRAIGNLRQILYEVDEEEGRLNDNE